MKRSALAWLAAGLVGYALLPWYLVDGGSLSLGMWRGWPLGPSGSGLFLGFSGERPWLAPIALSFAIATVAFVRGSQAQGLWLIAAGAGGLAWFVLQAFAINHQGWTLPGFLQPAVFDNPKQAGLGYGGFATALSLLMLLTHGLAARGLCRGDAFVASAIGLILALIGVFVFFPVTLILVSALQDNSGHWAPAEFVAKFFDSSIWGLGCVTSTVRCGIAWNTLLLAVAVGLGTTVLGLAFALIVTRTPFKAKGLLRALTVLPIITPPFVIGLVVILLFGRTGAITSLLDTWLQIPRSRWIYGFPGVFLAQLLAFTPIAFLVIVGVVQGVSPSLEEASQTLRANSWRTFQSISLPLMRPGLANAFLLGFVESMADFGNPLVLAGNFEVLSTRIFFAVVGAANDQGKAAVYSIILLAFTLGAFWVQHRWLGRASYTTVTGKGDGGLPVPLP